MKVLWFLTGFIYSVVSMLICLIPMSIDMGSICINKKKFFWQVDEQELIDQLDKGDPDA